MKDELPDLTPYLNKKGGNSPGRGEEIPAPKTDISQKLSALVKKPGSTGTHPSVQPALLKAAINEQQASNKDKPVTGDMEIPAGAGPVSAEDDLLESPIGLIKAPTESPIGIVKPQSESPIGILKPAADNPVPEQGASAGSNGQISASSNAGSANPGKSSALDSGSAAPATPAESVIKDSNSRWGDLANLGVQPWPGATDQKKVGSTSDNAGAPSSTGQGPRQRLTTGSASP